jgi:hypothetical protein
MSDKKTVCWHNRPLTSPAVKAASCSKRRCAHSYILRLAAHASYACTLQVRTVSRGSQNAAQHPTHCSFTGRLGLEPQAALAQASRPAPVGGRCLRAAPGRHHHRRDRSVEGPAVKQQVRGLHNVAVISLGTCLRTFRCLTHRA